MDPADRALLVKAFTRFLVIEGITVAVLFLVAGTVSWPGPWILLGYALLYILIIGTVGLRKFPQTVLGRAGTTFKHAWDRRAILFYVLGYVAQFVIAGLEMRFTGRIDALLIVAGAVMYGFSHVISYWAMAVNPFAIGSARIQEDRGQRVVSSGPYRYLRHPMYFSVLFFALGTPLLLNSWWSFAAAPIIIGAFIYRCAKEDGMLRAELPGYEEYCQRVRYRMIPFVW